MRRRRPNLLPIGTISSGTLHPTDLIHSLADALAPLRLSRAERQTVREAQRYDVDRDPDMDGIDLLDELYRIADTYAPPYCYVGSLEGDGAEIGVWPVIEYNDLPRYPAGESPSDGNDCMEVTDHGNVSCGRRLKSGRWIKYWSVV